MNAKEMFEELGYRKKEAYDNFHDEPMDWNYIYYKYDGTRVSEIHINDSTKLIFIREVFEGVIQDQYQVPILTLEILKAINKQIEELGW